MGYKCTVIRQNFHDKNKCAYGYTLDFLECDVDWPGETASTAIDNAIATDLEVFNANAKDNKYYRHGNFVIGPDGNKVCCYTYSAHRTPS